MQYIQSTDVLSEQGGIGMGIGMGMGMLRAQSGGHATPNGLAAQYHMAGEKYVESLDYDGLPEEGMRIESGDPLCCFVGRLSLPTLSSFLPSLPANPITLYSLSKHTLLTLQSHSTHSPNTLYSLSKHTLLTLHTCRRISTNSVLTQY